MPTTINKVIAHTGGDYATPALFAAARPASLVTADEKWVGSITNDGEFTASAIVYDSSGKTQDATRFTILQCGSGQSFRDNAGVRSNALKYNQSNGVALRKTGGYDYVIYLGSPYDQVIGLQIKADNGNSKGIYAFNGGGSNRLIQDCLIDVTGAIGAQTYSSGVIVNTVVFQRATGANGITLSSASKAIGCSVIRTTDVAAGSVGYESAYSNNIIQSCASFGFTTCATGSGFDTTNSKNNATDLASGFPGTTANQYNISYSSVTPFTNATVASCDLRSIAGTNLINNGFKDATNAPNDISGTARSSTPTIGHWEVSASAAVSAPYPRTLRYMQSLLVR